MFKVYIKPNFSVFNWRLQLYISIIIYFETINSYNYIIVYFIYTSFIPTPKKEKEKEKKFLETYSPIARKLKIQGLLITFNFGVETWSDDPNNTCTQQGNS